MDEPSYEDIVSERFIHDELARRVKLMFKYVYDTWRREIYHDIAVSWPADDVTYKGETTDQPFIRMLIGSEGERMKRIKRFMLDTQSYGILVIEKKDAEVRLILETVHGSKCWKIPIEDHGDVRVLGKVADGGRRCLGLLWRPLSGSA